MATLPSLYAVPVSYTHLDVYKRQDVLFYMNTVQSVRYKIFMVITFIKSMNDFSSEIEKIC